GPFNRAIVGKVMPGSLAEKEGLKEGDEIIGVNGKDIQGQGDLNRALGGLQDWPRGETRLELKVRSQKGEEKTISYTPYTLGLYPTQLYESLSMLLLLLVLLAYTPLRHN